MEVKPPGTLSGRCENKIKKCCRKIRFEDENGFQLAEQRVLP